MIIGTNWFFGWSHTSAAKKPPHSKIATIQT